MRIFVLNLKTNIMVLFVNTTNRTFFFKYVKSFENQNNPPADSIDDVLGGKPSEITAWNYYGYYAIMLLNNVGAVSQVNKFRRIYAKERLELEKQLNIKEYGTEN